MTMCKDDWSPAKDAEMRGRALKLILADAAEARAKERAIPKQIPPSFKDDGRYEAAFGKQREPSSE